MDPGANVLKLVEKTSHFDKDERYMATSDIIGLLKKESKMESFIEQRVCAAILRQLNDSSADVQAVAIKCIGELTNRVQEAQLREICSALSSALLGENEQLKDIYSIGLKTTVSGVPAHMGHAVAHELAPQLIRGIQSDNSESETVREECLDVMKDLVERFGLEMEGHHETIIGLVMEQLSNRKAAISKRATSCIGALSVVLSDTMLHRLMGTLLKCIEKPRGDQDVRVLIQTIGMISRSVGFRLGIHLPSIIPLFLSHLEGPGSGDEDEQNEELDDLRENILHAFESFAMRCPKETEAFQDELIEACLRFMTHDPNYNYSDSDEEDEEYSDDDYSDGEYSDDDDTSWKVRRASIKVLRAFVVSNQGGLGDFYDRCSIPLVERFKEREDSVKLDVLGCVEEMLKGSIQFKPSQTSGLAAGISAHPGGADEQVRGKVEAILDRVLKGTSKLLTAKKTSAKVKIAVFTMLQQLAFAAENKLEGAFGMLVPHVTAALKSRDGTLKLQALIFLRVSAWFVNPSTINNHMGELIGVVTPCVDEEWYKIIAEALRVLSVFAQCLRPMREDRSRFDDSIPSGDCGRFGPILFDSIFPRFSKSDIDQEIKECSILALGSVIAHVGDACAEQLKANDTFQLLLERLQNEVTRMAALKTLTQIATTPLDVDLCGTLEPICIELSGFLRQQLRALKQSSLMALDALVLSKGKMMQDNVSSTILKESSVLITDVDLHLSHLALRVATNILSSNGSSCPLVQKYVLGRAMDLASSTVLQGLALRSLQGFLATLVSLEQEGSSYDELCALLLEPLVKCEDYPRSAILSIAQCVSVLAMNTSEEKRAGTVERFVNDVANAEQHNKVSLQVALFCIGEIGHQTDLSPHKDLYGVIVGLLQHNIEQIRSASAYALGSVAVGNMSAYLPAILDGLKGDKSRHYQFLITLKEAVMRERKGIASFLDQVLDALVENSESSEENVRSIAAECLGTLCAADEGIAQRVFQTLAGLTSSKNQNTRWTATSAIRFCSTKNTALVKAMLAENIHHFLNLLEDDSHEVRKATLLSLNSIVHHHGDIVRPVLDELVPKLYAQMLPDDSLVREIDLGPFRQKVDDGFPIRKAAFTCMESILDSMIAYVELGQFLSYLQKGLADGGKSTTKVHDIKMLCHQILVKMCTTAPNVVVKHFAEFFKAPLEKVILKRKVKSGEVGTSAERGNDVIRSALRCVVAMSKVPGMQGNDVFQKFIDDVKRKSEQIKGMLLAIQSEGGSAGVALQRQKSNKK
jgi:cullin-associated NEDD8-dissociated protein 1